MGILWVSVVSVVINVVHNSITCELLVGQVWEDQVLRWDPALFGGVTHIRLPATALWTPDIVLYNKYGDTFLFHFFMIIRGVVNMNIYY